MTHKHANINILSSTCYHQHVVRQTRKHANIGMLSSCEFDAHVGDIITLCDRYAHSFTSWAGSGVYGLVWVVCS